MPSDSPPPHLPPGVTAYDLPRVTTWRRPTRGAVAAGTATGAVVGVGAVLLGAPLGAAALALVAGWALLLVTYPLPKVLKVVVVAVGFSVGVAATGGHGAGTVVSFVAGTGVGTVGLTALLARRDHRRRLASAAGAPAVDHDPRGGTDVGTLATWRDAVHEYEALDPDPEVVLEALRRLDGVGNTTGYLVGNDPDKSLRDATGAFAGGVVSGLANGATGAFGVPGAHSGAATLPARHAGPRGAPAAARRRRWLR